MALACATALTVMVPELVRAAVDRAPFSALCVTPKARAFAAAALDPLAWALSPTWIVPELLIVARAEVAAPALATDWNTPCALPMALALLALAVSVDWKLTRPVLVIAPVLTPPPVAS